MVKTNKKNAYFTILLAGGYILKIVIGYPPVQSKIYSTLHTEEPSVYSIQIVERWVLDPRI